MSKFIKVKLLDGKYSLINFDNVSDLWIKNDDVVVISFITDNDYFMNIDIEEYNRIEKELLND